MANLTPSQVESYRDRKVAETAAKASVEIAGIQAISGVLGELVSAAKANPLMGVILAAVVTDVLGQAKVIRPNTQTFLFACIGTAFGVTVAIEVADATTSILDTLNPFKSGPAPPDPAELIKPVPTTLVENPPSPPPPPSVGGAGAAVGGLRALSSILSA